MNWVPQILPFPWMLFLLFSMVMIWSVVCMYTSMFLLTGKQSFPSILHDVNKWLVD